MKRRKAHMRRIRAMGSGLLFPLAHMLKRITPYRSFTGRFFE
jgi:hypothetical protein